MWAPGLSLRLSIQMGLGEAWRRLSPNCGALTAQSTEAPPLGPLRHRRAGRRRPLPQTLPSSTSSSFPCPRHGTREKASCLVQPGRTRARGRPKGSARGEASCGRPRVEVLAAPPERSTPHGLVWLAHSTPGEIRRLRTGWRAHACASNAIRRSPRGSPLEVHLERRSDCAIPEGPRWRPTEGPPSALPGSQRSEAHAAVGWRRCRQRMAGTEPSRSCPVGLRMRASRRRARGSRIRGRRSGHDASGTPQPRTHPPSTRRVCPVMNPAS